MIHIHKEVEAGPDDIGNDPRPDAPVVRYAPVSEVRVYEISEAELEQLASGQRGQVQLSFSLALLPAALTVFVTLQIVEIQDLRVYSAYWIAFWLLFVQGSISLVLWWVAGNSTKGLIDVIRARMLPIAGAPSQPVLPSGIQNEPKP